MKKILLSVMAVMLWAIAAPVMAADPVVASGQLVKVDYTLTVDGQVIETSAGKKPLEATIGNKKILTGLENGLMGMRVGEEKTITVQPKDAYGEVDAKAVKEFPKSAMPKDQEPKVGMVLQAQAPDGETFPAVITAIKDDKVVLDFNHPLAGKTLVFKVKVLDIKPAPAGAAAKSG